MNDPDLRFDGIARLYGREGLNRLRGAHVAVVGIGGVGSWAVEALARSGVGALTLVDLDDVCVTNINRQLHALESTVGRPKIEVLAERLRAINPKCRLTLRPEFFTESTASGILAGDFAFVVDAIDAVSNKCRLLTACCERGIPVVCCGAAGGRRDATAVRVADMAEVSHDRLLTQVRRRLRQDGVIPRGGRKANVPCVFSPETPVPPTPEEDSCDSNLDGVRLNCDWGLGSASFVTGTFGFAAAGLVVQRIASGV